MFKKIHGNRITIKHIGPIPYITTSISKPQKKHGTIWNPKIPCPLGK
jgi:hypothetical protein